ncbi:MAG UNVERIFIED_CONTAM: hypothetical protein LVT10_09145 [Anaerolineae bacterium]
MRTNSTIWGLIWYAQTYVKKYTDGLHRVNQIALAATAFFVFLHLVQTHIWYDGLAQDVSIFSSQWSVIIMLIWIIIMENQRRGVFFGQKLPFPKRVMRFARKYHGYYFAWAVIYTFWYHPMETTGGICWASSIPSCCCYKGHYSSPVFMSTNGGCSCKRSWS